MDDPSKHADGIRELERQLAESKKSEAMYKRSAQDMQLQLKVFGMQKEDISAQVALEKSQRTDAEIRANTYYGYQHKFWSAEKRCGRIKKQLGDLQASAAVEHVTKLEAKVVDLEADNKILKTKAKKTREEAVEELRPVYEDRLKKAQELRRQFDLVVEEKEGAEQKLADSRLTIEDMGRELELVRSSRAQVVKKSQKEDKAVRKILNPQLPTRSQASEPPIIETQSKALKDPIPSQASESPMVEAQSKAPKDPIPSQGSEPLIIETQSKASKGSIPSQASEPPMVEVQSKAPKGSIPFQASDPIMVESQPKAPKGPITEPQYATTNPASRKESTVASWREKKAGNVADKSNHEAVPSSPIPRPLMPNTARTPEIGNPEVNDEKSVKGDPKPVDVAPEPADIAPKPMEGAAKPVETDPKPVEVDPKPVDVTPKPANVASKPAIVAPKPEEGDPKPMEEAAKPVETDPKPADVAPKPVEGAAKPEEGNPKPEEGDPKPVDVAPKPMEGDPEPMDVAPEPAGTVSKPVDGSNKGTYFPSSQWAFCTVRRLCMTCLTAQRLYERRILTRRLSTVVPRVEAFEPSSSTTGGNGQTSGPVSDTPIQGSGATIHPNSIPVDNPVPVGPNLGSAVCTPSKPSDKMAVDSPSQESGVSSTSDPSDDMEVDDPDDEMPDAPKDASSQSNPPPSQSQPIGTVAGSAHPSTFNPDNEMCDAPGNTTLPANPTPQNAQPTSTPKDGGHGQSGDVHMTGASTGQNVLGPVPSTDAHGPAPSAQHSEDDGEGESVGDYPSDPAQVGKASPSGTHGQNWPGSSAQYSADEESADDEDDDQDAAQYSGDEASEDEQDASGDDVFGYVIS